MIIALDAAPLVTRQIGGVEQHARNLVAQWAAQPAEHRFVLLLPGGWLRQPDYDPAFLESLPMSFKPRLYGAAWRTWPATLLRRFGGILLPVRAWRHFDVFHSFSGALPRRIVAPMVHTIHDMSCELDPFVRDTAEGWRTRRIYRRAIRRARYTLTVSQQTRADIVSIYHLPPRQVRVVYNGINPVFTPVPDPVLREQLQQRYGLRRRYLLLVGSDIPRRNYRQVWVGLRQAWAAQLSLQAVFAGRNVWPETAIYRQAVAEGCLDRVIFVPSPSDRELAQLYRDALLTCCGSSFEGFGLSVLEAMACGCCVACSDLSSLRALAGDAVCYFAHDDPAAISEAIQDLAVDPEYRRQLRELGLRRAARYNWANSARRLLLILQHAAGVRVAHGGRVAGAGDSTKSGSPPARRAVPGGGLRI